MPPTPPSSLSPGSRRHVMRTLAGGGVASLFQVRGLFAETLQATAQMTEGPYYPDKMPLDTDNDLLVINDSITPAVGEITYFSGKILSLTGEPVRNAFVEIWQVDNAASYLHTRGRNPKGHDGNFQGYGRFLTASDGAYHFRTIKPVPYAMQGMGRAPHIHVAVSQNGRRILTTQCMVRGHEQNARDMVMRDIRDAKARETVMADFRPLAGSKIGELTARFDVVLGGTAMEGGDGRMTGGIGARDGRGAGFGRGGRL